MLQRYIFGKYLAQIDSPIDLRAKLKLEELPYLASDIRQYIVDVVSNIGNSHFGASLGVVELTIAIHYVYNTPIDKLVWDVGHQAYGHKILTERKHKFHTNRKKNGISGFPKMDESIYDAFGTGHSSTSISAVLGMAVANEYLNNKDTEHIAVIGDGALTGGMAFEGLNHAGSIDTNITVVLNDNCMSIDPNVGALKGYLSSIAQSNLDDNTREKIWELLSEISNFGSNKEEIVNKVSKNLKISAYKQSHLFESLNFQYFGPYDGHDSIELANNLKKIKKHKGAKIVHVLTKKGAGYKFSEEGNPTQWHAPGIFDKNTGEILQKSDKKLPPKFQDVFGDTIIELAQKNDKIMAVTPAMPTGCSLDKMMKIMPERAFDVGIAEQHAVTFSAGLATQGIIPFCNIYSTFIQRSYDQIIHDVALQKLPVIFCLDRGGLVGYDGATHHGAFDLAFMRNIPNMIVSAPMDEMELRNLMYSAQYTKQPYSIRYPRGRGQNIEWKKTFQKIEVGTGRKLKEGDELAILSIGNIGNLIVEILHQEKFKGKVAHYDMRFVKPLDRNILIEVFSKFNRLLTIENGCLQGGFGSAVLEFASNIDSNTTIKRLGLPDYFIQHGSVEELMNEVGLDKESIEKQMIRLLDKKC